MLQCRSPSIVSPYWGHDYTESLHLCTETDLSLKTANQTLEPSTESATHSLADTSEHGHPSSDLALRPNDNSGGNRWVEQEKKQKSKIDAALDSLLAVLSSVK